jgi:TonB family protein
MVHALRATACATLLACGVLLVGCAGTAPKARNAAASRASDAEKVPLHSTSRFDEGQFKARYDRTTGRCATGSTQFLSQDELYRVRDAWIEDDAACAAARKLEVPASTDYPALLQARGISGSAHVLVLIDRDGSVQDARAVCATDSRFAESAEATARAIAYAPATCAGEPARSAFLLPFNYSI